MQTETKPKLELVSEKPLPVIELFGPTMQGEGALAGMRTHFVRFGGCTFRCDWCDSMHAVEPEQIKANRIMMPPSAIVKGLIDRSFSVWVTLTGGDPCIHDLRDLIARLHSFYFKIAIETQGALNPPWLKDCDLVTLSPKPPSSSMKTDYDVLQSIVLQCTKGELVLKVVVFDDDDLKYASDIHSRYPAVPFYLSVGTPKGATALEVIQRYRELTEKVVVTRGFQDAVILPQLHYLLWGSEKGR